MNSINMENNILFENGKSEVLEILENSNYYPSKLPSMKTGLLICSYIVIKSEIN